MAEKKMGTGAKAGIGLGVAALIGLGIWWLATRGKAGVTTPIDTLAQIKAESDRLGRPLTIEEANLLVYSEEELKHGIVENGFEQRVILPAVEAGLITMSDEDISFWLQQTVTGDILYVPWEELEARAAEISATLGMDIGAGEMRQAAFLIQYAQERAEAEAMGIIIEERDPVTGEVIATYPWTIAYEMAKVEEAEALGIPTTGRQRRDIMADLAAVEAGTLTVAQVQEQYDAEIAQEQAAYAEALRQAGASEESIQRHIEQNPKWAGK